MYLCLSKSGTLKKNPIAKQSYQFLNIQTNTFAIWHFCLWINFLMIGTIL